MELDKMIGKFDKLMHERGHWFMVPAVLLVALILFLLWFFATRRLPEEAPSAAMFLRHLL